MDFARALYKLAASDLGAAKFSPQALEGGDQGLSALLPQRGWSATSAAPQAAAAAPIASPAFAPAPASAASVGGAARRGGSLAWRNQNPGNIRFGEFAKAHGGVAGERGFARFPSEDAGRDAGLALLKTKPYQALTVGGAISRWAPPVENNTAAYIQDVAKRTKLDPSRPMSSLRPEELSQMFSGGIQQHEGWTPGAGE